MAKLDSKGEIIFLNYGFHDNKILKLNKEDEKDRYGIQLYHKIASAVKLKDKKVLEVGCGKGGGSSYIARYLKPKQIIGLDKSKNQILFNKKHYNINNLKFQAGDALNIPFSDKSIDVVINIESSHCYPNFGKFIKEVKRVLTKNGYFLFADFRKQDLIQPVVKSLKKSGLKIIKYEEITKNVLEALDLDHKRRIKLMNKFLPKFIHGWGKQFAGIRGSETYNSFKTGKKKYFFYVLQKK